MKIDCCHKNTLFFGINGSIFIVYYEYKDKSYFAHFVTIVSKKKKICFSWICNYTWYGGLDDANTIRKPQTLDR